MRFTFQGNTYRIVFRHEKSRLMSDHVGHAVEIRKPAPHFKHVALFCVTCKLQIGGYTKQDPSNWAHVYALPKRLRQRKTWCCIQVEEPNPSALFPDAAKPTWLDILSGCGRPNYEQGDVFERKAGREAAFVNTLTGDEARAAFAHLNFTEEDVIAFTAAAAEAYAESRVTNTDFLEPVVPRD